MTADEIRALEIETAQALGWTEIHPDAYTPFGRGACGYLPPTHPKNEGPFGNYRHIIPRFITDPAATTEVRDWIDAQLWGWVSANRGGKYSDIVVFEIYSPEGRAIAEAFEERSKHGGKASQAEAAAMCRCVLQACRATGATTTTETAEQAAGQKGV